MVFLLIGGGIGALQPPPTSELSPFLQEKADDIVAMSREDQGLPEIGSYEDQVPKPDPRDYPVGWTAPAFQREQLTPSSSPATLGRP